MFFNKLYCEVEYFPCPHLNQIYEGFNILEKNGFIEVKLIKPKEMRWCFKKYAEKKQVRF